ncbi:MAG: AraC family transcriptional regulator [Dongiaceae bacterium]
MSDRAAARTSIIAALPGYLAERGVAPAPVLLRAGIPEDMVDGPAGIVARAQLVAALDTAARLLGDETLGLRLGQRADARQLGPTGRALTVGTSFRQSLEGHVRFMPSLQAGVRLDLAVRDRFAAWRHELLGSDPAAVRILYEGAAAFLVTSVRRLLGPGWAPSLVRFPHPAPGDRRPYEEFFRAPVRFAAPGPSLVVFEAALLDRSPLPAVAAASRTSEDPGQEHDPWRREIESFALSDAVLVGSLEAIIDGMMMLDRISLPGAAATLGLSVRTLQRRLGGLGLSFEALTEARRRRRAAELLADPGFRITDVALMLGYSEPAHLTRAFHRWHGVSPARYRRRLATEMRP